MRCEKWLPLLALTLPILVAEVGCSPVTEAEAKAQRDHKEIVVTKNLIYIKDDKTGLCFAYYEWTGNGGPAIATVDCVAAGIDPKPESKPKPKPF